MNALTANQQSFVAAMKTSDELARKGFQLLLQRADYALFFGMLQEAGFFEPTQNPAPVAVERENGIRIPFWVALDYLKAVAAQAGAQNDMSLATKVMNVVRAVSVWRDDKGEPRRNYNTNRVFAEILGIVPTRAVTVADINLVGEWLNDPYERMLIALALDKKALPHFLSSIEPEDWKKATRLLYELTAIAWSNDGGDGEPTPSSIVDDFSLGELLQHHAKEIGRRANGHAIEVMIGRVREVFSTPMRRDYSNLFRPSIGDDAQNYQWRSVENRVVEGLRDVLLGRFEENPNDAKVSVRAMLKDDLQIVRRVAVYILAQHWSSMADLYDGDVIAPLFNAGHSYEFYHLLADHFADMSPGQQLATLGAIENLQRTDHGQDPENMLRQRQYRWLSAIKGKGCAPADRLFAELDADPKIGKLGDHPAFDSYITGGPVGPGPTAFSSEELAALTQANAVVDKLNAFTPTDNWRGPTIDGLSGALGDAARTNPDIFLVGVSQFLSAKPVYQQAVINGLKGAWEAKTSANWDYGWDQLVKFLEQLVSSRGFWQQKDDIYQHWAVAAAADLLSAGTKDDEHAYDANLLPRTQEVIGRLLDHEAGIDKPDDDAMMQALNTPKGRVIEALYSHALRAARLSDRLRGTHQQTWEEISPLFDQELAKCRNANYEFSTLSGTYLPQLQYLDGEWVKNQVGEIFPTAYLANAVCALDGLAYAAFTRPVYELLTESGTIDRALGLELRGRSTREKLLERIAAAYLWGAELLDGPRLTRLFSTATSGELDILIRVFWMVRNNDLTPEKRERILAFWERVQTAAPTGSLLAAYITTVTPRELLLLEAAASRLHGGHASYEFIAELLRLAPQDPAGITNVLKVMIASHVPDYDYKDRLVSLLQFLADSGQRQAVILMSNQLRHLPGAAALFKSLTH